MKFTTGFDPNSPCWFQRFKTKCRVQIKLLYGLSDEGLILGEGGADDDALMNAEGVTPRRWHLTARWRDGLKKKGKNTDSRVCLGGGRL